MQDKSKAFPEDRFYVLILRGQPGNEASRLVDWPGGQPGNEASRLVDWPGGQPGNEASRLVDWPGGQPGNEASRLVDWPGDQDFESCVQKTLTCAGR